MNKYNDMPVKMMLYPAICFMVIGMLFGVYIAFNGFIFPDYFSGEYIHFGRVRPVHVWHVLLLWLLSANVGLTYFFVPRLCGVSIFSPPIAFASIILWWFSLIVGTYSFFFGTNFGWEYAEIPHWVGWIPVKILFVFSWLLFAFNIFMTIANRVYEKMFVSLWYIMGTCIWTTITVLVGFYLINWVPEGISRVNASFFYVHNLVGLIFTPFGVAAAYYFLPKLSNIPIYSHRLSMIGFWSVAFVYAWVGTHHMIHGPASQWLQTTSIVFSIWLFIPVWTVVANLFATLKGNWHKYLESVPIRFLMVGNMYYLVTCIQGPLMALRNINEITSKTDWVIGHSHVSLYGTFTFFAIAGVYYAIPIISNRPLWSTKLAEWHFNLNLIGSFPFIMALWIGGFLQGMMWSSWADGTSFAEFHNNYTVLSFLQTIEETKIWWIIRAIGGIIILFSNLLFLVNMFNTILLAPSNEERQLARG
jgi:cytochrome c oxidase cbb3-type subunit 1